MRPSATPFRPLGTGLKAVMADASATMIVARLPRRFNSHCRSQIRGFSGLKGPYCLLRRGPLPIRQNHQWVIPPSPDFAHGQSADSLSAWNYDAINIYANAIKSVDEDRSKIMNYILGIHGHQGVCGTYDVTPNGDGLHADTVVQVEPGDTLKFLEVVNAPA